MTLARQLRMRNGLAPEGVVVKDVDAQDWVSPFAVRKELPHGRVGNVS